MEAAHLNLLADLPDPAAAQKFLAALAEKHPRDHTKLNKNAALLSDIATIVSFSPLLATTLLQNPGYIWWLDRKRKDEGVPSKEDLMESLGQFTLTNSSLDPQVLFARFRRRELLRIYLRDIRRLATIAEITEEISNLADAILESALRLASREIDNRFGQPLEQDDKGRSIPSKFCIAALGKLGSRELNYSSDIDLLFLYSNEGGTAGGSQGKVTNREYFVKLAELITKLVGGQSAEGAAYRVDLRLRPHGTLGALAVSVNDLARYYRTEGRAWERQVLIRSRGCVGDIGLFRSMLKSVEGLVFSKDVSVADALHNVRQSREKIDVGNITRRGTNIKVGRGGIREIEFIAQALQLAHGGHDAWLRSPHTLVTLARLADRKYLTEADLSELSSAYEFLRRTEHVLQMENGLQTHSIPQDAGKLDLLCRRIKFTGTNDLERDLKTHTANVSRIYSRVFAEPGDPEPVPVVKTPSKPVASARFGSNALLNKVASISPHFAAVLAAYPDLAGELAEMDDDPTEPDYRSILIESVQKQGDLGSRLAALRKAWAKLLLSIAFRDILERISMSDAKHLQTLLGEASIAAAIEIVEAQLPTRLELDKKPLHLGVLALGKLGGRALDYNSDLDLLLVYDDAIPCPSAELSHGEFYARAVALFVDTLSSMTRDGHLYRIDLRLRPYGSKGLSAISRTSFLEYMRSTAAVWEMLAFVKLRAVGGDIELAADVEHKTRSIIHERALTVGVEELGAETLKVRLALEKQRARIRRGGDIDIKYGAGGLLDVYFATRYLQLRDNVPDDEDDRSTSYVLNRLREKGSLPDALYSELIAGYDFLSALDHNLRLTIGRTTRLPTGDTHNLTTIAARMSLDSPADLIEQLTLHRLSIRSAFEAVVGK